MNKVFLIIQREYLTRVRKKSFVIMTIIGPLLLAAIMIVPAWLALREKVPYKIQVIDETYLFSDSIPSTENISLDFPPLTIGEARRDLYETDYSAILYIPRNLVGGGGTVNLFYKKPPTIQTKLHLKNSIEKRIFDYKLLANKIDIDVLKNSQTVINFTTEKQHESGQSEETSTEVNMMIGLVSGILIYIFIFLYGVQVMRGVIEEKTNRIVEIIISSVKPFQLMLGKIVGIALVGLTQFILWLVLTTAISSIAQVTLLKNVNRDMAINEYQKEEVFKKGTNVDLGSMKKVQTPNQLLDMYKGLKSIDFIEILACFLFYFLGGYLLYSALFAAIGSAVDNEADSQQFMLPVTIPLILSFVMAETIIHNPDSSAAFWFSMIPFTSPVVMMVRLPFGVPPWEVALSMLLLIVGFLFTTWLAGKIYRTGILMYGKKVNYKELWKWLIYKS